jgi:glycosyltransferase involved in cell wall biosynthesis
MVIYTQPMVAIFMVTYNHEKYIEEAVESIVSQLTNFKYTLFIAEDCSTDNTRNLCIELSHKYLDKIHLVLNPTNMGGAANSQNLMNICCQSGAKYIAMCEGDDYWTDPYKLQKQVDFLEKNTNASMVFSNCQVDVNGIFIKTDLKYPNYFTFVDYLRLYNAIPTCTMVFRKECINLNDKTIELIQQCPVGDFPLRFLIGDKGDFIFLPESTAVYRKHDGGISNNFHNSNHYVGILRMYKILNSYFNFKYDYFLGIHLQDTYERLFYTYCKDKLIFAAFKTFFKACIDFDGKYLKFNRCLNIFKHGVKEFIRK